MDYVLAVVTQFSEGQNEIHIKARGKFISKAVENNEKINVSAIEIILKK